MMKWIGLFFGLMLLAALACNVPVDSEDGEDSEAPTLAPIPSADTPDARDDTPPPGPAVSQPDPFESQSVLDLVNVTHWLYLIDVDLEPDTVEQIAASSYDMVVIDYIPSEAYNADYPMAQVIEQMHTAAHPKLVLAYIDIGEAESYRT